jgi:ABC-2 type transport system permease protein
MRILALAIKDLKQTARDRNAFLFLLLMPITFTFFFGWIFGSIGSSDEDHRIPIGWISQDETNIVSIELHAMLAAADTIRPDDLEDEDIDEATQRVLEGELAAVVLFPSSFTFDPETDNAPGITLYVDRATQAGQTAATAVQAALSRLIGSNQTAEISTNVYAEINGFDSESDSVAYFDESFGLAIRGWEEPPLGLEIIHLSEEEEQEFNPYFQASPGMLIQFTIFGLINSASIIVIERKGKTLSRMITTPISRSEMIAGHILAMFTIVFLQQMILITMGHFLGLDYFHEPLALLLLVISFALFACCFGLLVGVLVKTEEQVLMVGMLSMFLLTALAGAWFPLELSGETFAKIGHLTPTAWAMDGFQNLILRGQGLEGVLPSVGILLAYAAVCFALSVWQFRYD